MRVLNYHGTIGRRERDDHYASLFTDHDAFAAQVAFLARRCHPVSLSEIRDHVSAGRRLPPNAVHVSFDDGYRNNLVAADILDHYRVPWSLFVIVDAVLDGYQPWTVRLADALTVTSNVRGRDGSVFEMSDRRGKRRFRQLAKAHVMAAPAGRTDELVDEILALPGVRVPEESRWPFLRLNDLRQLRDAGVEIGNHSARHHNLTRCRPYELEAEIRDSRSRLEAALSSTVDVFAYPDGRHDRAARRVVARDHELAFATWTYRPALDRWAMLRVEPGPGVATLEAALGRKHRRRHGLRRLRWTTGRKASEALFRVRPASAPLVPPVLPAR